MYYPEEVIQEVRARTDIVTLVSGYVTLTRKGQNYWGCCPFHNEKTPSFSVKPQEQFFYCFGCHAGGNAITFLMQIENMTFQEALTELAARAGVELPKPDESRQERERAERKGRILDLNHEAAAYYYRQLMGRSSGERARAYLGGRGVTQETLNRFGLGYAPARKGGLYEHLTSKGFTREEILTAHLISERGDQTYDFFFNRLMFPIFNTRGQVIAFGGRVMGQGEPKYLNSPDTITYNKRRELYALNLARKSKRKQALLTEGYMDVIALHQAGFDNAVASLGTALTDNQAMLIKRFYDEVVLVYDSDDAGTRAARRAIPMLEAAGLKVRVMQVPDGKDPDEYLKLHPPEAFEQLISSAVDPIEFEQRIQNRLHDTTTADGKYAIVQGMAQRIAQTEDNILRKLQTKERAETLEVDAADFTKIVERYRRTYELEQERAEQNRQTPAEEKTDARMQLLAVLIRYRGLLDLLSDVISEASFIPDGIHPDVITRVADSLYAGHRKGTEVRSADLISLGETVEEQKIITRLLALQVPEQKDMLEKMLTDTVKGTLTRRADAMQKQLSAGGHPDMQQYQEMIALKKKLQTYTVHIPDRMLTSDPG